MSEHPGADASAPTQIPPRGWWQVAKRTWAEMGNDRTSMVAAGLAYYAMFALFPLLAAIVSIWGLFADPAEVASQLDQLAQALPEQIAGLIGEQLRSIASSGGSALGFAAAGGILFALYSASKGTSALVDAMNIAYDEEDSRSFVKRTLLSLGLTLVAVVFVIVAIGLVAVLPAVLGAIGLGGVAEPLLQISRWPLLALAMIGFLAILFRYAPCRDTPKWQWASPGAIAATVLWLGASALFSLYIGRFGNYNETYGALGAVIVMLLWLYISGYIIVAGAELNAELEHQTTDDTTVGPREPMGERGAYVADHTPTEA